MAAALTILARERGARRSPARSSSCRRSTTAPARPTRPSRPARCGRTTTAPVRGGRRSSAVIAGSAVRAAWLSTPAATRMSSGPLSPLPCAARIVASAKRSGGAKIASIRSGRSSRSRADSATVASRRSRGLHDHERGGGFACGATRAPSSTSATISSATPAKQRAVRPPAVARPAETRHRTRLDPDPPGLAVHAATLADRRPLRHGHRRPPAGDRSASRYSSPGRANR
jgi:hypothetical protein